VAEAIEGFAPPDAAALRIETTEAGTQAAMV
jgi:hypothetical protein